METSQKHWFEKYSEEEQQQAFKFVNDNNVPTKSIAYATGVDSEKLLNSILEIHNPKSYAVLDMDYKLKIVGLSALLTEHYNRQYENILPKMLSDITKRYIPTVVMDLLVGKIEFIIFNGKTITVKHLNVGEKKFTFVYPALSMKEECIEYVKKNSLLGGDPANYHRFNELFNVAIKDMDMEEFPNMTNIKFYNYDNLKVKLKTL